MNKKLLVILGISLAINFILIGFETAKIIYQPAFSDIPPERPQFIRPDDFRPGGPDFPDKKLIREAFKNAVKNHHKEMKNALREVKETLKTEPFDIEQFKAAVKKATAVRNMIDTAVQENITNMLSKMTPEERRRFADHFSQKGHPDFQRRQKRPDRFAPRHHRPAHRRKDFRPNKGGIPFVPPCMRENVPCCGAAARHCPCVREFNRHNDSCLPCERTEKKVNGKPEKVKKDTAKKMREMKRLQPAKVQPAE
ncbi:MAG: periplasmic heavy metal sensor [Alphaproteobacteria bacterium]|nr:periplasmic heavy metal sensor [Alphaproteobacteria bacterium]